MRVAKGEREKVNVVTSDLFQALNIAQSQKAGFSARINDVRFILWSEERRCLPFIEERRCLPFIIEYMYGMVYSMLIAELER